MKLHVYLDVESLVEIMQALGAGCAACSDDTQDCPFCQQPPRLRPLPHRLSGLGSVYSVGAYRGTWRKVILQAKEQPSSPVVDRLFHTLGQAQVQQVLASASLAIGRRTVRERVVACAPPASWRRRWRGWHLAGELQRWGQRAGNWGSGPRLRRCRLTAPQASLSGVRRRNNLVGAFRVGRRSSPPPRELWLLDDVLTTGSTLTECARALRAAGVTRVHALVLSHVPDASAFREA